MNSAGNRNSADTGQSDETLQPPGRFSGVFLLVTGGLIAAAAIVILQLFPILYGILFPPLPPIVPGSVEFSHRHIEHGVDEWVYTVETRACEAVAYFQSSGGVCPQPYPCIGLPDNEPLAAGQNLAECEGRVNFSIFAMRWIATISSDTANGFKTVYQLSREVFWGGQIPPKMEDLINQIDEQQNPGNTGE